MTCKLQNHASASASVQICNDGSVLLISYTTMVCKVDSNGWLHVYGLYSATTRKHIGWFLRERYQIDYSVARDAYNGNYEVNVFNGAKNFI